MTTERSLVIKYLCLSAVETGLYVYYAHDTLNYYYKKQLRTPILDILFSELNFSATRVLCFVAICDTILNNSLESFYIFIGLKLTIFALIFSEIPFPYHIRYTFIYYLIPLIAQIVFVVVHYDNIIRGALWKYYRVVGSSPTLQNAYNVSQILIRSGRFCVSHAFCSTCIFPYDLECLSSFSIGHVATDKCIRISTLQFPWTPSAVCTSPEKSVCTNLHP